MVGGLLLDRCGRCELVLAEGEPGTGNGAVKEMLNWISSTFFDNKAVNDTAVKRPLHSHALWFPVFKENPHSRAFNGYLFPIDPVVQCSDSKKQRAYSKLLQEVRRLGGRG